MEKLRSTNGKGLPPVPPEEPETVPVELTGMEPIDDPEKSRPSVFDDLAAIEVDINDLDGTEGVPSYFPIKKPGPSDFVRVHPTMRQRLRTYREEQKAGHLTHYVHTNVVHLLEGRVRTSDLRLAVDQHGDWFLWDLGLSDNSWAQSARAAAKTAETEWVKLVSKSKSYETRKLKDPSKYPEPRWPDIGMAEILKIAFAERIIDRPDHPAIREHQGAK